MFSANLDFPSTRVIKSSFLITRPLRCLQCTATQRSFITAHARSTDYPQPRQIRWLNGGREVKLHRISATLVLVAACTARCFYSYRISWLIITITVRSPSPDRVDLMLRDLCYYNAPDRGRGDRSFASAHARDILFRVPDFFSFFFSSLPSYFSFSSSPYIFIRGIFIHACIVNVHPRTRRLCKLHFNM